MSTATLRFLLFTILSVGSVVVGYAGRKRGWMREEWSRPIHFHTATWAWGLGCLLTLWLTPLKASNLWIIPIEMLVVIVPTAAIIWPARRLGYNRAQAGVLVAAGGISNVGFSFGGYLCYLLIQPADEAVAYAGAVTVVLTVTMILAIYPLARHYGANAPGGMSVARLVLHNLLGAPAWPLYAAIIGLTLALAKVSFPRFITDWYLLDLVFYGTTVGAYLGAGLCLRFGAGERYLGAYLVLAASHFVFGPLLCLAMLYGVGFTPWSIDPVAARVLLFESAMPVGITCIILANVFHLDTRMACKVWLWNTVMFLVLLPLWMWLLRSPLMS